MKKLLLFISLNFFVFFIIFSFPKKTFAYGCSGSYQCGRLQCSCSVDGSKCSISGLPCGPAPYYPGTCNCYIQTQTSTACSGNSSAACYASACVNCDGQNPECVADMCIWQSVPPTPGGPTATPGGGGGGGGGNPNGWGYDVGLVFYLDRNQDKKWNNTGATPETVVSTTLDGSGFPSAQYHPPNPFPVYPPYTNFLPDNVMSHVLLRHYDRNNNFLEQDTLTPGTSSGGNANIFKDSNRELDTCQNTGFGGGGPMSRLQDKIAHGNLEYVGNTMDSFTYLAPLVATNVACGAGNERKEKYRTITGTWGGVGGDQSTGDYWTLRIFPPTGYKFSDPQFNSTITLPHTTWDNTYGGNGGYWIRAVGITPIILQCAISTSPEFQAIAPISAPVQASVRAYQIDPSKTGTLFTTGLNNGSNASSNLQLYRSPRSSETWDSPVVVPEVFTPKQNYFEAKVADGGYSSSKSMQITLGDTAGAYGRLGAVYQGRDAVATPKMNNAANFPAGATLTFSAWYKTSSNNVYPQLRLARKYNNDWHGYNGYTATAASSATWAFMQKTITIPSGTQALDLTAFAVASSSGVGEKVWFDNISIMVFTGPFGPGSALDLITNGDFESGSSSPWVPWNGSGTPQSFFSSTFNPAGLSPGDYYVVCNNYYPADTSRVCTGNPFWLYGFPDCGTNSRIMVRVLPSATGTINVHFATCNAGESLSGASTTVSTSGPLPCPSCSATGALNTAYPPGIILNNLPLNAGGLDTAYTTTATLPSGWLPCSPPLSTISHLSSTGTLTDTVTFNIKQNVGNWVQTSGGNVHTQTGNQDWGTPKSLVPLPQYFNITDATHDIGVISANGTITCSDLTGTVPYCHETPARDWRTASDYSVSSSTTNLISFNDFTNWVKNKIDKNKDPDLGQPNVNPSFKNKNDGAYDFGNLDITITNSGLDVGTKKLAIFTTGTATIRGDITLDSAGGGFFAIFAKNGITVEKQVNNLAGIYLTDGTFTAENTNSVNSNVFLTVNGTVVAGGLSTPRQFQDLGLTQQNPVVKFIFDPFLLINMPEYFEHDTTFDWNEIEK